MTRPKGYRLQNGCHNCSHVRKTWVTPQLYCRRDAPPYTYWEDLPEVQQAGKCSGWEKEEKTDDQA